MSTFERGADGGVMPTTASASEWDDDAPDYREPVAEALALLAICRLVHLHRAKCVDEAVDRMSAAVDAATEARDAYTAAGDLLTKAMRAGIVCRGGVV